MKQQDEKKLSLALKAYRQGNVEKAKSLLAELVKSYPDAAVPVHYLGICLFESAQQELGLSLLEKSLSLSNNKADFLHNTGSLYCIHKQYSQALRYTQQAVCLSPQNIIYLGTLTKIYYELKQWKKAKEVGLQCLTYKDQQANLKHQEKYQTFQLKNIESHCGYQPNDTNIISFSLWGNDPLYTHGAIINAMIAPYIYPEWRVRFYVDDSVPQKIINKLQTYGAEILTVKQTKKNYHKLFWRFLVSDDENVTRFICRDCDSRLNVREKNAVDAWVSSGQLFHIMRDSYMHAELILAGMWGGTSGVLPNIQHMISAFYNPFHEKWIDQTWLAHMVWPIIKNKNLTHDTYYQYHQGEIFPEDLYRKDAVNISCVGSTVRNDLERL